MSFCTRSSFSTNYQTLVSCHHPATGSGQPAVRPVSVQAPGAQAPVSLSTSIQGNRRSGGPGCRDGRECARHRGYSKWEWDKAMPEWPHGLHPGEGEETGGWPSGTEVRSPGTPGEEGTPVRDWGHYFRTLEDLRAQIFANSVDSAHIVLQIDNVHLAADDFRSSMR